MSKQRLTDDQFIDAFERFGAAAMARQLEITQRGIYIRRRAIEAKIGRELIPGSLVLQESSLSTKAIPKAEIENGVVLVGSDCHYWSEVSTAHAAFLHFCKLLKPKMVVLNGDVLDFPRISRHPPIGWQGYPSVLEELRYCQARLREIERTVPKGTRLMWPVGNHDLRFESRLATAVPEFEGVEGTSLKDHFKNWEPCWGVDVNGHTVIKHRFKSGLHATHLNPLWAGRSMVTGHLHSAKVTPFTDYNGTRYGVDCGTMAEPNGPQFVDYTEGNPLNWRSAFAVLTFFKGRLLYPELVLVVERGIYEFRGEEHAINMDAYVDLTNEITKAKK